MLEIAEKDCPYCGEPLSLQVDISVGSQNYIEDCAVCCRPMVVDLELDLNGDWQLRLAREDD